MVVEDRCDYRVGGIAFIFSRFRMGTSVMGMLISWRPLGPAASGSHDDR
jgi:hypothetical protein